MDVNILGICITVFLSVIAIAVAIFFGLRGFTNKIADKVDETKNSVVLELSGIKENIIKIITRVDDVWQLASLLVKREVGGTIEVELKNFGKTKVSAELAENETRYMIQPEKGKLIGDTIVKMSKITDLARTELEMFGAETRMISAGNMLRVSIPSLNPELCSKYMSYLLRWLDTEYAGGLESQIGKFEKDIKI